MVEKWLTHQMIALAMPLGIIKFGLPILDILADVGTFQHFQQKTWKLRHVTSRDPIFTNFSGNVFAFNILLLCTFEVN